MVLVATLATAHPAQAATADPAPAFEPTRIAVPGTERTPAPTDLGRDLRTYLAQPGDQTIVVPAGTYTAGTATPLHPETDGPNRGWLVLVAERPGETIVDLSTTGFRLTGSAKGNDVRVVFVGFTFRNGMVAVEGVRNVVFWYCDFTFPAAEWQRQYVAAGGAAARPSTSVRNRMANPFPSAFRMRSDVARPTVPSRDIGIYGSDIHDVGDDGVFFYSTSGLTLQGVRIWGVDEGTHDPQDWWHNDSVQTTGGTNGVRIEDSYLGQKVQWGAQAGDIANLRATRLWIAGSHTVAWINDVWRGRRLVSSVQEDIRAWGNGQTAWGGYNRGYDKVRLDILDGVHRVWGGPSHGSNRLVMPGTRLSDAAPAGVGMRNGTMTDVRQALEHPDNPANRWRAEHGLHDWANVL